MGARWAVGQFLARIFFRPQGRGLGSRVVINAFGLRAGPKRNEGCLFERRVGARKRAKAAGITTEVLYYEPAAHSTIKCYFIIY